MHYKPREKSTEMENSLHLLKYKMQSGVKDVRCFKFSFNTRIKRFAGIELHKHISLRPMHTVSFHAFIKPEGV
jgi:hypothetical protein